MSFRKQGVVCTCNLRMPSTTPTIITGPWTDRNSFPSISQWSSEIGKSSTEEMRQMENRGEDRPRTRTRQVEREGGGGSLQRSCSCAGLNSALSTSATQNFQKHRNHKPLYFKDSENPQSISECYINILNYTTLLLKNHFHLSYF